MPRLTGKKALITGGSRGIGEAIVRRFVEEGAEVVLTYNSSSEKAKKIINELTKKRAKVFMVRLDGSKPEKAAGSVKEALKHIGHIDILVNNAGTGNTASIHEPAAGLDAFDTIFNVNVRTLYAVTHEAVKHMRAGGRIINISSILGERAIGADMGIYNASKFAVTGLSRSWAHDLGQKNITVNAIQPGPIDTDLNPAEGSTMGESTALKRYGETHEVASLAAFLASDESSYVTGATINVDGGMNA